MVKTKVSNHTKPQKKSNQHNSHIQQIRTRERKIREKVKKKRKKEN